MMQAGRAASAGYFIIIATAMGLGAGWWVDKRFGTAPWGLLLGLLVGVGAAIKELVTIARTTKLGNSTDENTRTDEKEPPPG
ncbi:MAG: AtpZ/AtpI family protein [Myxococcota bacterium]